MKKLGRLLAALCFALLPLAATASPPTVIPPDGTTNPPLTVITWCPVAVNGGGWTFGACSGGSGSGGGSGLTTAAVSDIKSTAPAPLNLSGSNSVVATLGTGQGIIAWTVTGITGSGATLTPMYTNDSINYYAYGSIPGRTTNAITVDGPLRLSAGGHQKVGLFVTTIGSGTASVSYNASISSDIVSLDGTQPVADSLSEAAVGTIADNPYASGSGTEVAILKGNFGLLKTIAGGVGVLGAAPPTSGIESGFIDPGTGFLRGLTLTNVGGVYYLPTNDPLADAALGTPGDAAYASGSGTEVAILKGNFGYLKATASAVGTNAAAAPTSAMEAGFTDPGTGFLRGLTLTNNGGSFYLPTTDPLADAALGTPADAVYSSGNGTEVSLLKGSYSLLKADQAPATPAAATATSSTLAGATASAAGSLPTVTQGNQGSVDMDLQARLWVDEGASILANPTGAATSGASGTMLLCNVGGGPTYTVNTLGTCEITTGGVLQAELLGPAQQVMELLSAPASAPSSGLAGAGAFNSTTPALANGQGQITQQDSAASAYVDTEGRRATYSCSISMTPILGDNIGIAWVSKVVRIRSITLTGAAGSAGQLTATISKRSTADGTSTVTPVLTPSDSLNVASTNVCKSWTVAPTQGTLIGTRGIQFLAMPVFGSVGLTSFVYGSPNGDQSTVLRAAGQEVDVTFSGTLPTTNPVITATIEWTESTE